MHSNDRNAATYRINKNISEWCLSSIKTTAQEKRQRHAAVIHNHDRLSSPGTTDLSCISTHRLSCISTPSEETLKEKEKKKKETAALRAGSLSISDFKDSDSETQKRDSKQEAEERKQLSDYRNKMAKSRLYTDEELVTFKDKSLRELMAIDHVRLRERNPHILGGKIGLSEMGTI